MLSTCDAPALTAKPPISSTADDSPVVRLAPHELTDADILSVLCDLFAGRAARAFGEPIAWWAETLQCDLNPVAAVGVALTAISKWQFDREAGATGVKQLQDELILRARQILDKGGRP
ncbi:hypothetical protein D3C86_1366950 [compost metagenome]